MAGIYEKYYLNNQWKINQRTPLANEPSTDMTTWDAARFALTIF